MTDKQPSGQTGARTPHGDMERLDQLAAAYGVQGGSLGPVVAVIARNAPHVLGRVQTESEAVMETVSIAVIDPRVFDALTNHSDVPTDVRARMEAKAAMHNPTTPAAVIVSEVLDEIRRALTATTEGES